MIFTLEALLCIKQVTEAVRMICIVIIMYKEIMRKHTGHYFCRKEGSARGGWSRCHLSKTLKAKHKVV